jgi:very-short-patch-repair endonuclease
MVLDLLQPRIVGTSDPEADLVREWRLATPHDRRRARELRQRATEAEEKAWTLLRNRRIQGFKFRRQHPIAGSIVDFYCAELRLVLEIDGGAHFDPQVRAYDRERQARLEGRGLRVVRITNDELSDQRLREAIHAIASAPVSPKGTSAPLSPKGRGVGG